MDRNVGPIWAVRPFSQIDYLADGRESTIGKNLAENISPAGPDADTVSTDAP